MKKDAAVLTPYIIVLGINFYLLPLGAKDTGMAMFLLLGVMPLVALMVALLCGIRHGFNIILPIAALLLFIPTIGMYYNSSAWVYAAAYPVVVVAGMTIGKMFSRKSSGTK